MDDTTHEIDNRQVHLPIEFSMFVLIDLLAHPEAQLRLLDDVGHDDWLAHCGVGGALFHADGSNLEAHITLELHPAPPHNPPTGTAHTATGTFRSDSGQVLLAATTGSPDDTTIHLPHPGHYHLHTSRHPDTTTTRTGDESRCEQWTIRIWPATTDV
ncbi:hypothetical protein AB0I60_05320 [Actinosynnema sp. NPDC050436]|uniref:hypothetical protein n=1 Tax=Actinosynnema sp. NPDC050436 TaxID=3155659 RepID=UPI0033EA0C1D